MLFRNLFCFFVAAAVCFSLSSSLQAQDRDRGDRGSYRGSDGGDRGSWGGRSGGDRGSWGSPGGGPPGGFGGGFGGPPGGFGGGPPGGFGGPPGGFGGSSGSFGGSMEDRSSRFAAMLDRDGNGKLDQEELDRMPSFVQDMMKSRGVQLRAGTTVEDIKKGMLGGPTSGGDNRSSTATAGNSTTPALRPYRQKEQPRTTLDLPPKYSELDTDFDGQLAFHEWLASRREDIQRFQEIDVNEDAFLTPRELQDYEDATTRQAEEFLYASIQKDRLIIVNATSSASRSGDKNRDDKNRDDKNRDERDRSRRSSEGGSDADETAKRYFSAMDRNQNGRIDMEEWDQSRRLRPMFEQAGIQIGPMSADEFARNLARVSGGR